MISHLTGIVLKTTFHHAIIDVYGVGYKLAATGQTLATLDEGKEVSIWTHLAVRENALDLYGFANKEELAFFELLITVSGIGPKTALNILNVAPVDVLRQAVFSESTAHLIKVSGVGKKNAEKIVLELRGKLHPEEGEDTATSNDDSDALEALTSLGYSQKQARDALRQVSVEIVGAGERVKQALKILSI